MESIEDPDWVVERLERRSRRLRQIRRFRECQRLRRRWLSFEEIADWCAREPGSVRRTEGLRAQAYADLRDAMLAGEFGHRLTRTLLSSGPGSDRGAAPTGTGRTADMARLLWSRRSSDYNPDPFPVLAPPRSRPPVVRATGSRLAERIRPCRCTARANRACKTPIAGARRSDPQKSSITEQEERSGSLHADSSPPEQLPNAGKQRAAYRAALSAWMAS